MILTLSHWTLPTVRVVSRAVLHGMSNDLVGVDTMFVTIAAVAMST